MLIAFWFLFFSIEIWKFSEPKKKIAHEIYELKWSFCVVGNKKDFNMIITFALFSTVHEDLLDIWNSKKRVSPNKNVVNVNESLFLTLSSRTRKIYTIREEREWKWLQSFSKTVRNGS